MIIPNSKLLFWVALVVVPFLTLIPVAPEYSRLLTAGIFLFFIVVIADLVNGRKVLTGISAYLPDTPRLAKGRPGKLVVEVKNEQLKAVRLRVGLAFPTEVSSPNEDIAIDLSSQQQLLRFPWPCTGTERGDFFIRGCFLQAASPLGFWLVRKVTESKVKACVYPDLLKEKKHLSALFLNRGNFGLHPQRQVGQGRDFEELRDYIPGDNYDDIHWKATAKRGHPVTKIYQIERTQEVYVIIDASRLSGQTVSSQLGSGEVYTTTILERFITAALILGLAAQRQGDLFGTVVFTDKLNSFLRAGGGKAHFNLCRQVLYSLQPKIVTPDINELFTSIRLHIRRRALLIFLTSLEDPLLAENFIDKINLICRQHLVLINMVKPAYAESLFSRPDVGSIDDIYQKLGGHILLHRLLEAEKLLRKQGAAFNLLDNEKMCVQLVSKYINIKQRQML